MCVSHCIILLRKCNIYSLSNSEKWSATHPTLEAASGKYHVLVRNVTINILGHCGSSPSTTTTDTSTGTVPYQLVERHA